MNCMLSVFCLFLLLVLFVLTVTTDTLRDSEATPRVHLIHFASGAIFIWGGSSIQRLRRYPRRPEDGRSAGSCRLDHFDRLWLTLRRSFLSLHQIPAIPIRWKRGPDVGSQKEAPGGFLEALREWRQSGL